MTQFADDLCRWNLECTGWEPSMSLLQKGADDAADLIDELCGLLATQPPYAADTTFAEIWNWLASKDAALAKACGGGV